MCGIVGYCGKEQAAPILLEGLSKLEYRGYDSAGIAVRNESDNPEIVKAKGRLHILAEKTNFGKSMKGTCGIGHTRWATHGEPSVENAHPHATDDFNVVGVHNGIIENYRELKDKLIRKGYTFYSDTDTEVAIKTIDYYYKKYTHDPIEALAKTMVRVRGSYALAVIFRDCPNKVYVARKDSPLVIGVTDEASYCASDVPALLEHTRNIYYINDLEMAELSADGTVFYNLDGDTVAKEPVLIDWDTTAAERGGYEHFMIKEIHEQPKTVADTLNAFIKKSEDEGSKYQIDLSESTLTDEFLKDVNNIYLVACGSTYHAGVTAQYVIEQLTGIPVRCELASEFRYRDLPFCGNSLVIAVSQSGETADTLAALRLAKNAGVKTLGVVNVVGSSIAREADCVLYTVAGPEIAVATTKAYSSQLIVLDILAIKLALLKGTIDDERATRLIDELFTIPDKIKSILDDKERLQWFASKVAAQKDVFFIGRGIDYAVCLEGSLKLKEITYIHSEAYAAGELKHGTISLIEDGLLVISVLTQSSLFEKTLSNLVEVKSRGAYTMALTTFGNYSIEDTANFVTYVPRIDDLFAASLAIVPLQLLSYYVSVARGLDVDKPRNLAKSVTVE